MTPYSANLEELRQQSPFPWRYSVVLHTGQVLVTDAAGAEVPLFTLCEVAAQLTAQLMRQEAQHQANKKPSGG